jgi:ssDNA-specific exonuclease RecJ
MKVFVELGIFSIKGGLLNFNQKIKNALTNSNLYSKIYMLKD